MKRDLPADEPWPFQDPKMTAVLTTSAVMKSRMPILLVSHDEDDGCWQFLDGGKVKMKDAMVVGLCEIVQIDPSVSTLADLPFGWQAWRDSPSSAWQRRRHPIRLMCLSQKRRSERSRG